MGKFLRKIKKSKTAIFCITALCIFSFLIGNFSSAQVVGAIVEGTGLAVATLLSWIAWAFIMVFGLLLTLFVAILVNVAQFSNIIDVPAVVNGWVIVRDLCNMFFILILLIIAFATILRQENYSIKKMLPKLLIMAVLINFSKTIFGLLIDFSQVVMLTFVNGFAQHGAGNFINMFQTNQITAMWTGEKVGSWPVVVGIIAGVIALIITNIVILVMLAILVMRIIMLWIYTILSPFVFLGFAFPPVQKYTGQIWEDFNKQLVVGPVLAFFIWLALATASESSNKLGAGAMVSGTLETQGGQICAGASSFFCEGSLQTFIITIGLLMGGMMVAQKLGGVAGSIAGKGLDWAKKTPGAIGKAGLWSADWAGLKLKTATGLELRPWKMAQGLRETLKQKKETQEKMGESKAGAALKEGKLWGALGASRDFTEDAAQGFMWHKGWLGKDSAISRTRKRGKSIEKIDKLDEKLRNPELAQDSPERKDIEDQLKREKGELAKYRPIETFYADEKRNTMAREKMKLFYDSDNEDYLHSVMMNAMESGQTDVAMGAYLQMSKSYHDNEALNKTVATADWHDEKGRKRIEEGEQLPVNQYGKGAFVDQYLMGKLGLSKQEALSLVSQSDTMSKANMHHIVSEGVGVENGRLRLRSIEEQTERAAGEFRKGDQEGNMRRANRLGHMGEKQFKNPDTGEVDRVNTVTDLTKRNFISQMGVWEGEVNSRKRFNPNFAQNLFKNHLYLKKYKGLKESKKPEDKKKAEEWGKIFKDWEREDLVDVAEKIKAEIPDMKTGNPIKSEQIAWQTLEQGAVKYYSELKLEIANSDLSEDDKTEKTTALEKEEKAQLIDIQGKIKSYEEDRPNLAGYDASRKPKTGGKKR